MAISAIGDAGLPNGKMSAVLKQSEMAFRPMLEADIEAVMAIEKDAYEFPWTLNIFRDCIKVGYCCWILEQGYDILGYGVMCVSSQEAHVLNLCIKSNFQNNGLGQRVLDYLIDIAKINYASVMFLEVRPSNRQALKVYDRSGFNTVGSRRDYYPAKFGREDALILAKQLTENLS